MAVAQQLGKTRRTLYAALSDHLNLASDEAAVAHVASVLKHLPLLGTPDLSLQSGQCEGNTSHSTKV